MTRPQRLEAPEVEAMLAGLPGWSLSPDGLSIRKSFKFNDFSSAFGFMARVALEAEKLDHHPEWLNVYARVDVTLTTHSARGLTELDEKLARAMERLASAAGLKA